ncbi:LysR family transcriptional regulator [Granulosicoccus antarcticus]|uniref:HTH-type transcriptional regulator DmlR n=1 Tax=Granulosicoccus antarcticus IMCC3135 TaxID=1192854 RepID=A0A2Z2NW82_9GAMM|nr:LysR family transcriptional regulator [Granulosicoccus antarcticus]ASJ75716.1 HTH-type transcriptional regulator DmlR [Granulosicoccus antarcticus IMCC3135]
MNLDLQNLALFLRVSELGKIAKAGEEFGYSSTSASQRIRQLESEIGVSLFHRSTRVVTLTHDGEVFLEHAKRILDDVEEARIVFKGGAENVQGKLRITVSSSYGRIYIVPFIPELIKRYPELEIEIDFNDGMLDLIEHGYDVAFRIGELQSSSLLARKLSDNPALLVASPAYLEEHGTPQTPQELQQHVCLPFGNLKEWSFKDNAGKEHAVSVKGPVALNWGDAISDLVEAGVGIGKAYYWHAGPALKAGRVVRVLPDYQLWPQTSIWAVRPQGRLMPARLKVFLAYIEEVINTTNKERYGALVLE